jgi:hypothetical protein
MQNPLYLAVGPKKSRVYQQSSKTERKKINLKQKKYSSA